MDATGPGEHPERAYINGQWVEVPTSGDLTDEMREAVQARPSPFGTPTEPQLGLVRLWPDSELGPFRLRVWFDHVNGRPAVVGVEMWGVGPVSSPWELPLPETPATVIGAEDIRLPLGRLLDAWVELHLSTARAARKLYEDVPDQEAKVRAVEARFASPRPSGRKRLTDEFLQRVTEVYNAAISEGDRAPGLRVVEVLGPAAPDTARGWVRQARERGFDVVPPPNVKKRRRSDGRS